MGIWFPRDKTTVKQKLDWAEKEKERGYDDLKQWERVKETLEVEARVEKLEKKRKK